eukprot:TRINITY_DN4837_c0_g1_i1.p2 TRINITY_DN4837_c0_g1~~TRINITY_DN4837_c0_g1_i1.p2  ORF type:complete len:101 (+),score=16.08 TRINITY_DN4837_c0_g1_i1:327-629(+)
MNLSKRNISHNKRLGREGTKIVVLRGYPALYKEVARLVDGKLEMSALAWLRIFEAYLTLGITQQDAVVPWKHLDQAANPGMLECVDLCDEQTNENVIVLE